MRKNGKKMPPHTAFIPIGIMFIVIGMNENRGLIGAGILFVIAGIAGVIRNRKNQISSDDL
jgi:hypothetical protein